MRIQNFWEAQTEEKMCTDLLMTVSVCFSESSEKDTQFQAWTGFKTTVPALPALATLWSLRTLFSEPSASPML